jgi:hypothetical protein
MVAGSDGNALSSFADFLMNITAKASFHQLHKSKAKGHNISSSILSTQFQYFCAVVANRREHSFGTFNYWNSMTMPNILKPSINRKYKYNIQRI